MDTPATRRDALMGFGALFLALLGMPQFLDDVAVAEPEPDLPGNTTIKGMFVGNVGTEPVVVDLVMETAGRASKVIMRDIGRKRPPDYELLMLNRPAVGELIASIGTGMIATTAAQQRADPWKAKPRGARRQKPVPVTCPDCGGYRSFDCDTCEGAGLVPDWSDDEPTT